MLLIKICRLFLLSLFLELFFLSLLDIPEVDKLDLKIVIEAKVFNHSILSVILLFFKVRVDLAGVDLVGELGDILSRIIERPSLLRLSLRSVGEFPLFSVWLRDWNHGVRVHISRARCRIVECADGAFFIVWLVLEHLLLGGFAAVTIKFLPATESLLLRLLSEGLSFSSSSSI
jgi:hypothetical protein